MAMGIGRRGDFIGGIDRLNLRMGLQFGHQLFADLGALFGVNCGLIQ
jgi:hypothetical protein